METTVVFDIPTEVTAKLATGEYKRVGGVIQGNDGQVKMWLKEGGLSPSSPEELSTGLSSKMGEILKLTGAAASILNLGATIAFGMQTLSKLNKIDQKLNIIIEKLDEIERKIDKVQWSVDIGFANTFQALEYLKKYQEVELAGELNSAVSLAWSCQFLEPESNQRLIRIEQALSKSSGVVEKLLLHTEIEMNKAIEWMRQKRSGSSDFEIDDSVIQALFRFRQTCIACSVNASINAEAGDTYTVSIKLLKDQKKLFNLLYQLVNIGINSSNNESYKTLLDKSMLESMPIERIGLWIERFDSENTLNNVLEQLRKEGFSSNNQLSSQSSYSDDGFSNIFASSGFFSNISSNSLREIKKPIANNTNIFFDIVDGAYEDLERLKGYSLEYGAMHSMNLSIHEYRKMLQIDELPDGKKLIFISLIRKFE
jgi:hypothetical protein